MSRQSSLSNFCRPAKTGNEAPAIEGDRTDSEGEKEKEDDESACTDYEATNTKRHVSCLILGEQGGGYRVHRPPRAIADFGRPDS